MMRHLLLDSIERFDEFGKIPVFIPLKDYGDSYDSLLDYIFEKFEGLGGSKKLNDLSKLLSHGSCLLLFDGLDEIKSDCRKKFEHDLEFFADKYTDNMFVISSRPAGAFIYLHRFTVLNLCPFTKDQALSLIDKLDFRPDEPAIKANFRNELDNTLFRTHMEFTENPLLLTIMLMTYEQFAEIPSKMHIFYREAYITLSQKHDASKGAYKRVLKTGLTADRFADFFLSSAHVAIVMRSLNSRIFCLISILTVCTNAQKNSIGLRHQISEMTSLKICALCFMRTESIISPIVLSKNISAPCTFQSKKIRR